MWDLKAEAIDEGRSLYTNRVTAHPTDAFMAFLKEHGLSYEEAANARQAAGSDHNRRETPLFAASIARRAKVRAQDRANEGNCP
ncbi:hypothetical protein KXR53_32400 [Inquilinus limosus]|uniref:hypothetical protein n=1 Tax=Inquilinus limosus TaxID=171674 RepID=UPI003F18A372